MKKNSLEKIDDNFFLCEKKLCSKLQIHKEILSIQITDDSSLSFVILMSLVHSSIKIQPFLIYFSKCSC